jgi:hypothetical protein
MGLTPPLVTGVTLKNPNREEQRPLVVQDGQPLLGLCAMHSNQNGSAKGHNEQSHIKDCLALIGRFSE